MKVAAAGRTPRFPVTGEVGPVEMPVFARITKSPAVARFTGRVAPELPPPELPPPAPPPPLASPSPQAPAADESNSKAAPSFMDARKRSEVDFMWWLPCRDWVA